MFLVLAGGTGLMLGGDTLFNMLFPTNVSWVGIAMHMVTGLTAFGMLVRVRPVIQGLVIRRRTAGVVEATPVGTGAGMRGAMVGAARPPALPGAVKAAGARPAAAGQVRAAAVRPGTAAAAKPGAVRPPALPTRPAAGQAGVVKPDVRKPSVPQAAPGKPGAVAARPANAKPRVVKPGDGGGGGAGGTR